MIKRYEPCINGMDRPSIEQEDSGRFVKYTDHLAAIQAAKVEAVREARKRWAREDAESLAKRDAEVARVAFIAGYGACYEDLADGVAQTTCPDHEAEEKAHDYIQDLRGAS